MGKTKQWFAFIANIVGMTQIIALHSLDTPSGGGDRPGTDWKNGGRGRGSQSLLQHGKDKLMICSLANVVDMTQILVLHSLDTPSVRW